MQKSSFIQNELAIIGNNYHMLLSVLVNALFVINLVTNRFLLSHSVIKSIRIHMTLNIFADFENVFKQIVRICKCLTLMNEDFFIWNMLLNGDNLLINCINSFTLHDKICVDVCSIDHFHYLMKAMTLACFYGSNAAVNFALLDVLFL